MFKEQRCFTFIAADGNLIPIGRFYFVADDSELIANRQTDCQRTDIRSGGKIIVQKATVGNCIGNVERSVGSGLIKQVHDVERAEKMFRRLPADAGEGFPMAIKIGIVDAVRILTTKISGIEPAAPFVVELVRRIDFE